MSLVTPTVQTCYSCRRGQCRPRVTETRTNTEIIVEARWVCPNCGSPFKHGVVERKPLPNVAKK